MLKKGGAYCLLEDNLQKGRRLLFIGRQSSKREAFIVYWKTMLKKGGAYCLLEDSAQKERRLLSIGRQSSKREALIVY